MIWYDYIRGFADGQQDRGSAVETGLNPVLIVWKIISAVLFFVLTVCYAVLKGVTGLVGLIILLIASKRN
ncbi:MAG TPA: hypothetical protein PLM81_10405 [Ginsengibacter sp.]|nr:hypothetical protein [Ginsengibacter sp.]